MKLTKSLLKQLIKEEMSLSKEKAALNEGFFENAVRAQKTWACRVQNKIGREKTKSIATRVFKNATNWKNIIRQELEDPEWLIEEIDTKIPGNNWATMKLLNKYVKGLEGWERKWYANEIDKFLKC